MKPFTSCILLTLFFILNFTVLSEARAMDDLNLNGVVTDSITGKPVAYVTVSIQNSG